MIILEKDQIRKSIEKLEIRLRRIDVELQVIEGRAKERRKRRTELERRKNALISELHQGRT